MLPGASPETMGASVAGPIERQLSTIAGITSLTSTSSLGLSTIIIQFDLNRNIDGAALDVQTALTVAARRLPIEMTIPPYFRKVNPGDFSILLFSLVSPTLPLSVVDDYAEITLAQQISQLPGIAQVLVFGAQKFAVRVQVDPTAAAARGISLDDVRNVVAKANSNTPVGTISGRSQNTTITASAAMRHADEYKDVVVAYRNGLPLKIERGRQGDRFASKTTSSPISTTISARSCWRSSSSRTPIPSRSSIPSASACRSIAPRFRRRSRWKSSPTARCRSAKPSRTCR